MRLRRKLFGILTCIIGFTSILSLTTPLFLSVESSGAVSNKYKLLDVFEGMDTRFKALNKQFEPAFGNIVSVICIMTTVLYVLFVICFTFQVLKFGAIPYRPILRSIAVVMVLLGILAIASGLTFTIMNKVVLNGTKILSFKWGGGLYLISIGSIVAGICGAIGQLRY